MEAEAASRLKEELDTVKRPQDNLQAKLVDAERQRAASEARLEVLQRSKGWKPIGSEAGATSPSQSIVAVAPAATFSAQSMQILASGLLEYGHLGHSADGRRQVVVPAATDHCGATSNNHNAGPQRGQPAKGDAEVTTRLQNADRRYRSEVVAAAQHLRWEPEPVVGTPGSSVPGSAALW